MWPFFWCGETEVYISGEISEKLPFSLITTMADIPHAVWFIDPFIDIYVV